MNQKAATNAAYIIFFAIGILPLTALIAASASSGIEQLAGVFSGTRHVMLILHTVLLAGTTTFMTLLVGVPIGFALKKTDMPYKTLFKVGFASVLLIPPYINALAWIDLLGPSGALAAAIRSSTGYSPHIYGFFGSAIVLAFSSLPLAIFMSMIGFSSIGSSLEDAARLAKGWRCSIRSVILPLASGAIMFGGMLVFITAMSDFGATSFLSYDTFNVDIYSRLGAFNDVPSASAYSLVLVLVSVTMILVASKIAPRKCLSSISSDMGSVFRLGSWRLPSLALVSIVLTFALFLPLGSLMYTSASYGSFIGNYASAFDQGIPNITNSLACAIAGATVTVLLGFLMAYGSKEMTAWKRTTLESTILLPFIMPGTVFALGMISLWNFPNSPVYGNSCMIVFGYAAKFSAIMYMTCLAFFEKIPESMIDASTLVGGNWLRRFRRIIAPLMFPAIAIGWTIVYVSCVGELNTSLMVYPPGSATLPIALYIFQHDGPPGMVAALAVITVLICVAPIVIIALIWGNSLRKRPARRGIKGLATGK